MLLEGLESRQLMSAGVTYVSDLDWGSGDSGWGMFEKDRSNGELFTGDGNTITLNGVTYSKGIGVHSNSDIRYDIAAAGQFSRLQTDIGVDDEVGNNGSVNFKIYLDTNLAYESGPMTGASATKSVDLDITGMSELWLVVTDAGDGRSYDHADWANIRLVPAGTTEPAAVPSGGHGLIATYFDNADFTGTSVTRADAALDFDWGMGSPIAGISPDSFSVRWQGQIEAVYSQTYTFSTSSDDGMRVWVDNLLVVDNWYDSAANSNRTSGLINLAAGKKYDISVEYFESRGNAAAQLKWSSASQAEQIVPMERLYSTVTPARQERVYYVDNQNSQASDSNTGAESRPLKTITKAVSLAIANNKLNIATRVVVNPGVYRESISMSRNGAETEAPIRIEAASPGTVVLDGADLWTGWQASPTPGVYTHAWTGNWGVAATPSGWPTTPEVLRRRELLYVNGKRFTPVMSKDALVDDSFFVDDAAGLVYMRAPAGTDVANATTEWGTRGGLIKIDSKKNVSIYGLTVQHDTSAFNSTDAVSFPNSSNILLEEMTIQENSQGGISDNYATNVIHRRVVVVDNGGSGIGGTRIKSIMLEDVETSYNNWRGLLGNFTGWAQAGLKHLHTHGGIYRNVTAAGNSAYGFWLDTDVTNAIVDNGSFHDNLRDGMFLEASQGPITVANSKIYHNTLYGIRVANSANVTVRDSVLYDNWLSTSSAGAQINISGDNSGRSVTDFETGATMTAQSQNWNFTGNTVVGTNAQQYAIKTDLNSTMWGLFVTTLNADRNTYWNPLLTNFFQRNGGTKMNFAGWQLHTGDEANSAFKKVTFANPANGDFRIIG